MAHKEIKGLRTFFWETGRELKRAKMSLGLWWAHPGGGGPRIPGGRGHICGGDMTLKVPCLGRGNPHRETYERSRTKKWAHHAWRRYPSAHGYGTPHDQVDWIGAPAILAVAPAAALQQCLFHAGSSPLGMAHQPHELAQQDLQGPGTWGHQLRFLCQQPCHSLGAKQLYKWHSGNASIFGRSLYCH